MIGNRIKSVLKSLRKFLARRFGKITEINRKYAQPRIKMTPMVNLALLLLRIYLLLLVAILFYKFITIVMAK
ncbi:MAG: hypothetical protein ACYDHZ_11630 [Dehalococcoidia bacterium]